MQTTLLHFSDTHLGYQQYHKPDRETDFGQAFSHVITAAVERDVDGVVHAGDIFHHSRPSTNTLSTLVEQLQRLAANDIPFYTIVGNHDSTRTQEWPELIEDLHLGTYLGVEGAAVGGVTLYGQDHVSKHQRAQLEYPFSDPKTQQSALVAHGLFQPFPHGDWDLNEVLAKSPVKFDAVLLGDDHTPQQETVDGIPVTYPGSTERTAADQREQRGYNIVEFTDDGVSVTHEKIDTRPFKYIDVELDAGEGVDAVIEEVENATISDEPVVIVTLTGDGEHVPSGDIEQVGERHGALVTRVNDTRDVHDAVSEYDSVSLTDPDKAVQEKKETLSLSPVADDLEELARDEATPKSALRQTAVEDVKETIADGDVSSVMTPETDTDTSNSSESDDSDSLGAESQSGVRATEQINLTEVDGE